MYGSYHCLVMRASALLNGIFRLIQTCYRTLLVLNLGRNFLAEVLLGFSFALLTRD